MKISGSQVTLISVIEWQVPMDHQSHHRNSVGNDMELRINCIAFSKAAVYRRYIYDL